MKKIDKQIELKTLKAMTSKMYDTLVKGVVDVDREIMVVDAEMHADEEQYLLEDGSKQENLWGINLYPELYHTEDFIEFDSMINLRPSQENRSRGIEDEKIREKIKDIVKKLVKENETSTS